MDNETFDQHNVPKKLFGPAVKFLKEGMNLIVAFESDEPILSVAMQAFEEAMKTQKEIDVKNYAKYILREGTILEKRELLSSLKSQKWLG